MSINRFADETHVSIAKSGVDAAPMMTAGGSMEGVPVASVGVVTWHADPINTIPAALAIQGIADRCVGDITVRVAKRAHQVPGPHALRVPSLVSWSLGIVLPGQHLADRDRIGSTVEKMGPPAGVVDPEGPVNSPSP